MNQIETQTQVVENLDSQMILVREGVEEELGVVLGNLLNRNVTFSNIKINKFNRKAF